jgi:hypothetical protein
MPVFKPFKTEIRNMDKKKYILTAMAAGNVLLAGDIVRELALWLYRIGLKELPLLIAAGGLSETLIIILLIAGAVGLVKRDRLWGYWGACTAALLHSFHYLVVMPYFWGYEFYIPGAWLIKAPWTMFLYLYPIVFLIVINLKRIRTIFISRNKKPVLVIFLTAMVLVDYIAIPYPNGAAWMAIFIGFAMVLSGYRAPGIKISRYGRTMGKAGLQAEKKEERAKGIVGISVFFAILLILTGFYLKGKIGPYRLDLRENIKKEKMEGRESNLYN